MSLLRKAGVAVLVFIAALPIALFTMLYLTQEQAVFPRHNRDPAVIEAEAVARGATTFEVETSDGERLLGWHTPAGGERAVLYFHGNAGWCVPNAAYTDLLARNGWDYLCVAYRGYPGSTGSPTEHGVRLDAQALWEYATSELEIPPARIVLHGRSLGGGVALPLAAEVDAGGLVLESTFRSVRRIAGERYPLAIVDLLLRHPFDSESRAASIEEPTLVVHGDADTTIDVSHGRWLAENVPNAIYREAAGYGHNDSMITQDHGVNEAFSAFLAARLAAER
ncbi:MAG: alpha/beta hydrolase [Proteobacteria bacterium]|nr:alpha/beta hydrolase [Pseudomonadota bacterium]